MNEKQQQLTFGKGITNVPSDAICSDNTLEESLGMVYDNGEHRVIQKPKEFITDSNLSAIPKILYVHRVGNEERFITTSVTTGQYTSYPLFWGTVSNLVYTNSGPLNRSYNNNTYTGNVQVTSVGKTLIVSDSNSMTYFLWKNNSYSLLGNKIPEPEVEFQVRAMGTTYVSEVWDNNDGDGNWDDSIIDLVGNLGSSTLPDTHPTITDQEAYNELVIGFYRKLCNKASDLGCFTRPFMARYAIELYDGEYIYISNPVALFPSVNKNGFAALHQHNKMLFTLGYARLVFKSKTDYSNWSDLVKGVTVFVSQQVDVVDTDSDQVLVEAEGTDVLWNGVNNGSLSQYRVVQSNDHPDGHNNHLLCYKFNESDTILNKLKGTSNFYKLFDIGRGQKNNWTHAHNYIDSHVLKNLTTQQQLPYDDYYSHSKLIPGFIYSYNMRLNIADVSRSFFDGFKQFLPYCNPNTSSSRTYSIYVHISSEEGERVVSQSVTTTDYMGLYFYYPDSRATQAEIFVGSTKYFDLPLEEHPYLNGAYYFGGLPTGSDTETTSSGSVTVNDSPEHLVNYLIQSEVNNPFVFKAEGYHRVGMGRIIGMSSITQALSEGQFGQYPLLVFATDGIWALSTNNVGIYTSIHPMSREVALESNPCLTQTDGAVFFASEKGLMVVVGNQVKCVSEQLSGKKVPLWFESFVDFLRGAVIAYDYRDSMLWMFKNPYRAALVYSIKSGTFARFDSSIPIISTVNYYPDYLIQQGTTWRVYSMLNRLDINEDDSEYTGSIVTRPLKLENALALKSITQVRHIHDMNASATLSFHILASNNLKDWVELSSLRGTPWKYYKFSYDFNHLKATDRFSGTVVVTEERRTNKLR